MAIVKLISDFDGVWTNQDTEASYVWNYTVKRISVLTGDTQETINDLLIGCKKDMDRSPY